MKAKSISMMEAAELVGLILSMIDELREIAGYEDVAGYYAKELIKIERKHKRGKRNNNKV
jgi:hypothetical protein